MAKRKSTAEELLDLISEICFYLPVWAILLGGKRGQTQNIKIYSAPFKAWFLKLRKVNVGYRACEPAAIGLSDVRSAPNLIQEAQCLTESPPTKFHDQRYHNHEPVNYGCL